MVLTGVEPRQVLEWSDWLQVGDSVGVEVQVACVRVPFEDREQSFKLFLCECELGVGKGAVA